jgi:hypothetical protein
MAELSACFQHVWPALLYSEVEQHEVADRVAGSFAVEAPWNHHHLVAEAPLMAASVTGYAKMHGAKVIEQLFQRVVAVVQWIAGAWTAFGVPEQSPVHSRLQESLNAMGALVFLDGSQRYYSFVVFVLVE